MWLADLLRASFVNAPSHVAPSSSTAELSIGLRLGPALAGLSSLFRGGNPFNGGFKARGSTAGTGKREFERPTLMPS